MLDADLVSTKGGIDPIVVVVNLLPTVGHENPTEFTVLKSKS
jgi:hypothetical protein